MSLRRSSRSVRREARAAAVPNELPAELAAGPCIEVWAPDWVAVADWSSRSMTAWRAWRTALAVWAVESGWASDSRRASEARHLARTRVPWSRSFLLAAGRKDLVDYFEGRTAALQPTDLPRFQPYW